MRRFLLLILCTLGIASTSAAADGRMLYETYCGACHAPDGQGANAGQFPPLADSSWVKGPAGRMLQVILHGLQGEVVVANGEGEESVYNLAMPPQGAALTDEQIASIASYVRTSWGNQETPVTTAMVAAERKASSARTRMWTSAQLQQRFPLPGHNNGSDRIDHLLSYVHEGQFDSLTEMRKTKPVSIEEEQDGLISLAHAGNRTEHFGLAWEGGITTPRSGSYEFSLTSDDGSAVFVNDQLVVEVAGIADASRTRNESIFLNKGQHRIRVEYFSHDGPPELSLNWRGPKMKWRFLSEGRPKGENKTYPSIPLAPTIGKARVYRNFIEGTTSRGIGVGYEGGLNLAFSADTMGVELLWTGDFLDAGRHWTNRGQGNTNPRGPVVKVSHGPAFAILPEGKGPWPERYGEHLAPRFRGYSLNSDKQPTFRYAVGNLMVRDFPEPRTGDQKPGLTRHLEIEAPEAPPQNLFFRVATGLALEAIGPGEYRLGQGPTVRISSESAGDLLVRDQDLLVPLRLRPGKNTLVLHYTFQ